MNEAISRNEMRQDEANASGFTFLKLESSWWGNEKLGEWSANVWGLVDVETEDAVHLTRVKTGSAPRDYMDTREADVWFPKSKTDITRPDTQAISPPEEMNGTVRIGPPKMSRYGRKLTLLGDTYSALKEDDVADSVDWDNTHLTYDGDLWVFDDDDDALAQVVDELIAAGYAVKMSPAVRDRI